jgi:hypothetical protein
VPIYESVVERLWVACRDAHELAYHDLRVGAAVDEDGGFERNQVLVGRGLGDRNK